ncbi:MAG TPA: 50S ribosomal protein L11 methyltransferase [Stellaceae bacterium]|nr:50S ribosomal protein L11 methyltransferase [Stellaceae bacterium]
MTQPDQGSADGGFEQALAVLERQIEGTPNYARNLVALAELGKRKRLAFRAFELARKAIAAARGDAEVVGRARDLLGGLVRGYHVPMMNDARRNAAWSRALGRAVRPGSSVLEIGTGAGMLALMAARAGAGTVVTCERDPILATLAREVAALNGFGDTIQVIGKASFDLVPGIDLARPAELLFCDIFANDLLGFDPLAALSDARQRLVAPGAPVIPAAGAIRVALGEYRDCARVALIDRAAGFDLSPFADLARTRIAVPVGDPGIALRSEPAEAFRFDFAAETHPKSGRAELELDASAAGVVNGIVQWIRLELDAGAALEACPERGAVFFSALYFHPLPAPRTMRPGERLGIVASYEGASLAIRAAG